MREIVYHDMDVGLLVVVIVIALISNACLTPKSQQCADGGYCPSDYICLPSSAGTGRARCVIPACGNGNIDGEETCDDGNNDDNDGCSADCQSEGTCGNNVVDIAGGEVCDDGNTKSGDGCSSDCNKVAQVVAGRAHTCVLLDDGQVRCWGNNEFGQLGLGHTDTIGDNEYPRVAGNVNVGGHGSHQVEQLTAGNDHTCALLVDGTVRCWGKNDVGQLGYGHVNSIGGEFNQMPPDNICLDGIVLHIAAGGNHTCALLQEGMVRCWGANEYGQLGYGDTENRGDAPGEMPPPDVDIGDQIEQLTAGEYHTCVVQAGKARCWGGNDDGQLGQDHEDSIGDKFGQMPPKFIDLGSLFKVKQLACGLGEHMCALDNDNNVRCWGSGYKGQLGGGDINHRGDGEEKAMPPPNVESIQDGETIAELALGGTHTCIRLSSGKVRCWGENGSGQLGLDRTLGVGDDPGEMPPGDAKVAYWAASLGIGENHTCIVAGSAEILCWGDNSSGQLGYADPDHIGDDGEPKMADLTGVPYLPIQ